MHTRSQVQHHSKIATGTTVIGGAHLVDAYERKARRDKLPPRILSVVDTDHSSAQRQNLS